MSNLVHMSKFLSLVLRHQPQVIGLNLDVNGWADVKELIEKANDYQKQKHYDLLDLPLLEVIVRDNNKKRFAFNADKTKIRASQGHSINIDLDLKEKDPPDFLYHGTATKFLDIIKREGLKKMSRNHVHLSLDTIVAKKVGERHGIPVILRVKAKEMKDNGIKFYCSDNGVWLTDDIPAQYIDFDWKA